MAEISAASVKALRDRTGLPMMECKKALQESGGDEAAAIEWLASHGKKTMSSRSDRSTESGRVAVYADAAGGVGAMVEIQCESAPVANSAEFIEFAQALAKQLATGPGAATGEELLAQKTADGTSLQATMDEMTNRIREVFRVSRIVRIDAPCGGYAHHTGDIGVLAEIEGTNQSVANEICMQIAAMRPEVVAVEDLDPEVVAKEREHLSAAARQEGKPENIIEKMVEGRLKNFYAERVLNEQPFVKDDKLTVKKYAEQNGVKMKRFFHWVLGK